MNEPLHLPPYSTESEQALLGGILADAKLFDAVADIITEVDFYDHGHRLLFRRIALLVAQNKPVDLVTVEAALQGAGEAEAVGGFAYLAELSAFSPGAGSVKRYANIIRDRRLLRDLMSAANEIGDIALAKTDEPAAARLDKAEGILLALSEGSAAQFSEPTEMSSILSSVVESIQERYDNPGAIKGLSTGFVDFDAKTHGLQRGNLIIIAGRPSMGKTTWALNIAENVALAGGCSLVFSMEMSKDELAHRSLRDYRREADGR
jgi:replicative DNA helicase